MRRGWCLLALVALPLLVGAGEGSFDAPLQLTGNLTVAAALDEVSRQTGVRFAGRERWPDDAAELTVSAPLEPVLATLADRFGLLFTPLGLYDFLVVPAPGYRPRPLTTTMLGEVTAAVTALEYGDQPDDGEAPLVATLQLQAPSAIARAALADLDPDSLRLFAGGEPQPLRVAAYRRPEAMARRLGQGWELPFEPPPADGQYAEIRGAFWRYQEVAPLRFELPARRDETATQEDSNVTVTEVALLGTVPRLEMTLTRAGSLGEELPWVDLAVRGDDGRPLRPAELSLLELELPPGEGEELRRTTRIRALFPPDTAVDGRTCELTWLRRFRPWDRVEFRLLGLTLPPRPGSRR